MRIRWFPYLTLLGLLLLPCVAQSADTKKKKDGPPTVVVRLRSIDTVFEHVKFLSALVGKEEVGKQVEGLIKSKVGPKGLAGIDTRRPVGLYSRIGEDPSESIGVGMIPIADEKAFLGLLENLNVKAEKNNDGVYTVQQELLPVPILFRFANNYAYVTALNVEALSKDSLLPPAVVFPRNVTADISASLRLDQLPKAAKDLVLSKLEDEVAKAKDRKEDGETEAQQKVRVAALDSLFKRTSEVLLHGRELALLLNINRETKDLLVEMTLDAMPDSALSKDIKGLAEGHSLFGGMIAKDAAMSGLMHAALPKDVAKAFEGAIEDGVGKTLAKEKDPAKRKQMETFYKAIKPTLMAGSIDAGFVMRGPTAKKLYTFVAGVKLLQGDKVEKSIRDALADLPAKDREKIKLDADSVGTVKIHRIDAQDGFTKSDKEVFGENPIYVAIRPDALLVVMGEDGLKTLKEAIVMKGLPAPPLVVEMSMAKVAGTIAKTDEKKKLVQEAFRDGDQGILRLTLEGGPSLRVRFTTALSVFRLGAALAEKSE